MISACPVNSFMYPPLLLIFFQPFTIFIIKTERFAFLSTYFCAVSDAN
jgi:hypothetical protein